MSKSDRLYKDSPEMKRSEDGKVGITRPSKEASSEDQSAGTDGMDTHVRHMHERREMKHRHMKEHMDMHHKHEMEHGHHGHEGGHKGALHERHEAELHEMHKRHHTEMKGLHDRHEKEHGGGYGKSGSGEGDKEKTGGKQIEKIEKDKEE
jgi:hypothetical protein